ncbi:MAG TPA: discoidin domain-containing protein [Terriglobia bacterium]|nr:discoidin domain-containing protein [Terriglobia bacterium]
MRRKKERDDIDKNRPARNISRRRFLAGATSAAALTAAPLGVLAASGGGAEAGLSSVSAQGGTPPQEKANVGMIRIDATPGHETNAFKPNEALGTSIDMIPYKSSDKLYAPSMVEQCLSAGWGPMSYRQHTELQIAAWHWNPTGTWSDGARKQGYFTGSSALGEPIQHSYGYHMRHRGNTRNGGAESGFSRLTDGDPNSYWKSNPYLAERYTGESDALHPQWVVIDLGAAQPVNAVRIDWTDPYARAYSVQYWTGNEDAMSKPTGGVWNTFPGGLIKDAKGGTARLKLSMLPITARFLRILMTESSHTPDTHGPEDPRNSEGYAIREVYAGTLDANGNFVDLMQHSPDQNQTATYCSSIDPWHDESDLHMEGGEQTGFDLFFSSGVINNLPAMVPIAMLYGIPEDAAAQIAYLKKRGYPISYVEMGEEPDGQYAMPEDYAALYLQFASAIHRVVPEAKLGGPIFEGVNEDIKVWPDAQGRTSWLGRFLDYLKAHGRMEDFAFMSFEHYPFEPCAVTWSDLYREPELVSHILDVWREDGLPENVPMIISECNLSWSVNQSFVDIFGALWLAEYVGAFLAAGGAGINYFQFFPFPLHSGCHGWGTFGTFLAGEDHAIKGYTSQYFASRLINLEWVKPGGETHHCYRTLTDVRDASGNELLAAYALHRPEAEWSLMIVNRDQHNARQVRLAFENRSAQKESGFSGEVRMVTFGTEQFQWHADGSNSHADPGGPPRESTLQAEGTTLFTLPKASLTILRGKVEI